MQQRRPTWYRFFRRTSMGSLPRAAATCSMIFSIKNIPYKPPLYSVFGGIGGGCTNLSKARASGGGVGSSIGLDKRMIDIPIRAEVSPIHTMRQCTRRQYWDTHRIQAGQLQHIPLEPSMRNNALADEAVTARQWNTVCSDRRT